MPIILSALDNQIKSFEKAVKRSLHDSADEEVRDAVIQRFEYTYELCVKLLIRRLKQEAASTEEIETLSFRDLIRLGAEKGFIEKAELWFAYREQRNKTVHIYDERMALEVYQGVLGFVTDAKLLYEKLLIGNDD
jgi:nucleotidyltransferase substrate binding protein (TIGR01987 family)